MQTFNPSLYLSAGLMFTWFLAACGSEQAPLPQEVSPWQASAAFQFEMKYLPNARLSEGQLHVLTPYSLASMTSHTEVLHKQHDAAAKLWLPVPLTRHFFPAIDRVNRYMDFYSIRDMGSSGVARPGARISFGDLGADIANIWSPAWTGVVAANESGQMIAPFEDMNGNPVLFLFDVRTTTATGAIDTVAVSRINLPVLEWLQSVSSIGDVFFVGYKSASGASQTARVSPDGSVETVLDHMLLRKIFPFSGKWYAMGERSLYKSENEGRSWQLISGNYQNNGLEIPNMLAYTTVNGETILYGTMDSIYRLEATGEDAFVAHRIDREGLTGNLLTSLHEWNGRVYATTLSGLYYRDTEDFLAQPK